MKWTHVVFPDTLQAMLLASPASAILISLSIGDISIVPPWGLVPSWVAIVAASFVVVSRLVDYIHILPLPCPASSSNRPEVLEVPFRGQFDAKNRMPVSTCRSLSWLLSYFAVFVFVFRQDLSQIHLVQSHDR